MTFQELKDGRYRAVAFDGAEIHSCLTEKQRAEVAQFEPEAWFSQLVADHADGVIRREDVEGDEAWNRISGEPDLFGVEAIRHEEARWQVTFWVLEHVRGEPLESRLRAEIERSLRAVAGVIDVREEDREVYWVTGSPTGQDLVRAAAAVVDDLADELRLHYDGLGT